MDSLFSRVAGYYESIGAMPRPGASGPQLQAFEGRNGLSLPASVRALYSTIDGLDGEVPECGFHDLHLWRLHELGRVNERVAEFRGSPDYRSIVTALPRSSEFIAFGDGAIWSHVLAFRLSENGGPVIWISGGVYTEMAPSFEEYWHRYLENPDSMLWPTDAHEMLPARRPAEHS